MSTIEQVRKLIAGNPEHLITAALKFEKMYLADIDDVGVRRVHFELQRALMDAYPLVRPAYVEPANEAWDDETHVFWTTDPATVWDMVYDRIADQVGRTQARLYVHKMQQAGKDLI